MTYKELQRERLKKYLDCEERILLNQSYTIGNRVFTMTDLEEVRKVISALLDSGVTLEDDDQTSKRGGQTRAVFID